MARDRLTGTDYCDGVVIVHHDGYRTCVAGCQTGGSAKDHSVIVPCATVLGPDCPRCSAQVN